MNGLTLPDKTKEVRPTIQLQPLLKFRPFVSCTRGFGTACLLLILLLRNSSGQCWYIPAGDRMTSHYGVGGGCCLHGADSRSKRLLPLSRLAGWLSQVEKSGQGRGLKTPVGHRLQCATCNARCNLQMSGHIKRKVDTVRHEWIEPRMPPDFRPGVYMYGGRLPDLIRVLLCIRIGFCYCVWFCILLFPFYNNNSNNRWRGGATGRALDSRSTSRGFKSYSGQKLRNNLGLVVHTYVPLSPSSITWYRQRGGDALRLGR